MTTGNTNCEDSNCHVSGLPQVTEYCLLRLKERKFLMVDFQWLYDWFHTEDTEQSKGIHAIFRRYYSLEDFIHLVLENRKMDFFENRIQPEVDVNVLNSDQEQSLYLYCDALFNNVHFRLEDTLGWDEKLIPTEENNNTYNLVGFFGTTAIIGLGENVDYVRYPTFKESYGSFGNEKWRNKIVSNPILQTVAPIINGECKPFATF